MSSNASIKAENLGKRYEIYATPRDRLKQFVFPRFRRMLSLPQKEYFQEFWALQNVNFEVEQGSTVGILGKNGSGKSTLLQMICGTLTPTVGAVSIRGRVAALLELGSGFNPEFSGRENVFMNAAILGLSQRETSERYSEIVDFADIGDFIEHPVKMYSSGMYVRLAFAIAVSVTPEILVVDEALAVGDAGFQLKCALRMQQLQESGVTILFVSHDTSSIARLCQKVILLDKGKIITHTDDVAGAIKHYDALTRNIEVGPVSLPGPEDASSKHSSVFHAKLTSYAEELGGISEMRLGSQKAEFLSVEMLDVNGTEKTLFEAGDSITIRALIKSTEYFPRVVSGFSLKNRDGVLVWGENTLRLSQPFSLAPGLVYLSFSFTLALQPGDYFLHIGLADIDKERVELDQRWPVRKLAVTSSNSSNLGYVHAPAAISFEPVIEG